MSTIVRKSSRKPENGHGKRAVIDRLIDDAISYIAAEGEGGVITVKINIMPSGGIGDSYVRKEITATFE